MGPTKARKRNGSQKGRGPETRRTGRRTSECTGRGLMGRTRRYELLSSDMSEPAGVKKKKGMQTWDKESTVGFFFDHPWIAVVWSSRSFACEHGAANTSHYRRSVMEEGVILRIVLMLSKTAESVW